MTPRKHRHADMIRAWLDDDSLEVEHRNCDAWSNVPGNPIWSEQVEYRFKPRMIKCGDMEFPEPMRVVPGNYEEYWIPQISSITATSCLQWADNEYDRRVFKLGLCHATKAAAEAHARALIALTR